jgi:hypothetical protein
VTTTAGQELTAALRYYFSIGTRTRRYRPKGDYRQDLHHSMMEAIFNAAWYPGYFTDAQTAALKPGFGTALAYEKHVWGHRIDGTLACHINGMSAWQFSALLGEMADAGVSCTGDGERFFAEMARAMRQAA